MTSQRAFNIILLTCQVKDSNEEYPAKSIICHNSNKVVDGGDQWARGYGGVYTCFFENSGIQVPTALEISIARSRATPMQPDTAYANTKVFPLNK